MGYRYARVFHVTHHITVTTNEGTFPQPENSDFNQTSCEYRSYSKETIPVSAKIHSEGVQSALKVIRVFPFFKYHFIFQYALHSREVSLESEFSA